jgi:epoxyqueuosine reductase
MPTSISELEARDPRATRPAANARPAVMGQSLKRAIVQRASALGFDAVRVTGAEAPEHMGAALDAFLAQGREGDMGWLKDTAARRKSPRALWPEVRSVILLGTNYGSGTDPLESLQDTSRGAISVFAKRCDYHDVIKGKLKQLAGQIQALAGGDVKVFVDTAPVMEKPLAAKAGLGWQGKHTNLVSREYRLLAVPGRDVHHGRAVSRRVPPRSTIAAPAAPASMRARRTRFPRPTEIDARRCISYLTIEHDGPIPREFRPLMGNRIYGCDDCLAVCPWNKFAQAGREAKLAIRPETDDPPLVRDSGAGRCGLPEPFSRHADQTHRTRPLCAQRSHRGGQCGGRIARSSRRGFDRRPFPACARDGGMGTSTAGP